MFGRGVYDSAWAGRAGGRVVAQDKCPGCGAVSQKAPLRVHSVGNAPLRAYNDGQCANLSARWRWAVIV